MEFPSVNDVVICKVTKIADFGVFAELLEYDNLEGFIHISQISSTWIKNIHNHVKLNQMRAARVLKIDTEKKHIDLSLSRVTSNDEKKKISEYRLFIRAQALLNIIAKEISISSEKIWEEVAEPILETENSLYTGFLNILKHGADFYTNINKKYHKPLFEILNKNITIKEKSISGVLKIISLDPNNFKNVKKILFECENKNPDALFSYVAPSKYSIKVTSKDFKQTAKRFEEITQELSKALKPFASIEVTKNQN